MAEPTNEQRKFLRELISWGGAADPSQLKQFGGSSLSVTRQICKRERWATYDGGNTGYWRITDAGKAALSS